MNPDAALPFMDLRMAISEGKATRVIMPRTDIIDGVGLGRNDSHGRVINGPLVVIGHDPYLGRTGDFEVAVFAEGGIGRISGVTVITIEPGTIHFQSAARPSVWVSSDALVHGDTANHLDRFAKHGRIGAAVRAGPRVSRALEYLTVLGQKRSKKAGAI